MAISALTLAMAMSFASTAAAQVVQVERGVGSSGSLAADLIVDDGQKSRQGSQASDSDTDLIPGTLFLRTSFEFSSGDYGDVSDTSILYAPLSVRWDIDAWRLSLNVPFLQVDGPSDLVTAGGGAQLPPPNPPPPPNMDPKIGSEKHAGLGDITLGFSYALPPVIDDRFFFDLQADLKIPTADEDRGLGTGKTDVSLGTEVAVKTGKFWPYLGVAYRFVGRNSDYELQDGMLASAGLQWQGDGALGLGIEFDYRRALSQSADDPLEAVAYSSYLLNNQLLLGLYTTVGFSDGSPDYALGTSMGWYFD